MHGYESTESHLHPLNFYITLILTSFFQVISFLSGSPIIYLYSDLMRTKTGLITTAVEQEHITNAVLKFTLTIFMVMRRSLCPSLGAKSGFPIVYDEAIMSPHVPSVSVTS